MRGNDRKAVRVDGYLYAVQFAVQIFALSVNIAAFIRNYFFAVFHSIFSALAA